MYIIMKKVLLCLFTIAFFTIAQAQDAQKAKKLLDEVSAKVKSYNNIEIEFKYSLTNLKEGINQDTRGEVTLQGDKYLLNMMGAMRLFDGKKLYTISPEDEEVTISNIGTDEEDEITPSKMLTFYEKGYTYKWDIVQNVRGRKIQYIHLKPIQKSDIKEILLGIDSETKHIYKLIQKQDNGTDITITVNSFKTNQPLPKSLFSFDPSKYSSYYINNLD